MGIVDFLNKNARNIALGATFLVPLGLLHLFVLAEICIGLTDILFLAEMARTRQTGWAKQPWFIVTMLWWAWTLVCATPIPALGLITAGWVESFFQVLVIIRFIIFIVALQSWVLTTPRSRHILWMLIAFSILWIGLESWQQLLTGANIFGNRRFGDGALTGPFWKPRAGDLYGHLLFTALLPPLLAIFAKKYLHWRLAGAALLILGVVTSVLIGQRMGTAFTLLGLVSAAVFIPNLRKLAVGAVIMAGIILALTPIISPPTYGKLVGETSRQVNHYSQSPYGELETRAVVMGLQSPIHGWGYNGFRAFCPQDRFNVGLPAVNIPPTQLGLGACNLHPHNFYLQALSDAGFPGLILFILMNIFWLREMFKGIWGSNDAIRIGLFIGVLTFAWPIASTDEFPTLYLPGWLFLILGLGFAHTYMSVSVVSPELKNV
ncbi:MAG: hypothetical protein B7Z75_12640 [Acidocella sp. 20-57-95]|nr:MAG: hypothetical protein B7Z75_12640 [Acidocella sp. 20-57-95]OYV62128.1 MAG: hypothetical protein B7Z71_02410 [Acidocella sp. 21-58-7]